MIVSPIVYSKIKEVVFQIYEPERRKDVMWGKPADEYYDFYLYVDGHWELIEGIGSSKVPIVPCNLSAFVNDAGYLSSSNVAYVENSSTASKSYSEGDYLIYDSTLYKATTAINEGDTIEVGVNVVSTTLTDEIDSGGGGGLQSFEIIACNITAVDGSDKATVDNNNWHTEAIAAYEAKKIPVLCGQAISSGTKYSMILTVEKYTAGTDDYRIYGSAAITIGGSSPRRKILYAEMQSTHSNASIYISDFVDKLVSGTNIKTIDGTSLLGSGDVTIGVQEINASVTITGSAPNYTFTINNYADFYNAIVAAKTAGKIPVSRMVVNAGNWTITLVGIISNKTQTTFTTSFQDSGTGIYMSEFNSPSASTPYRIQYVEQQEKLVSGTNIKTINNTSLLGSGNIVCQEKLVSGINIKKINGNSILGYGNLTIPTGLSVAYEVVDAGMLYLDQTDTYYEVPATVYTALKTVWDAGKVPVLTGSLFHHTTSFALIPTYLTDSFFCFYHGWGAMSGGNRWHLSGRLFAGVGGQLYPEEEQKPITVDQTVIAGSTNPVSGNAVYESFEDIETVLDAILGSQVLNNGMERMLHTEEVAATLSPEIVHVFTGDTDTLAITLTAPTDNLSHLFTMILTTGTTPAVSIQVSDSTAIIYPDDYAIEAGTTYEISVLVANGKYYLRYVTYQEA